MFWPEPRAETMLQVAAQVISGRWDERLQAARALNRKDVRRGWTWKPQTMSPKSERADTAFTCRLKMRRNERRKTETHCSVENPC